MEPEQIGGDCDTCRVCRTDERNHSGTPTLGGGWRDRSQLSGPSEGPAPLPNDQAFGENVPSGLFREGKLSVGQANGVAAIAPQSGRGVGQVQG